MKDTNTVTFDTFQIDGCYTVSYIPRLRFSDKASFQTDDASLQINLGINRKLWKQQKQTATRKREGRAVLPRTLRSAWADSKLRKATSMNTEKVFMSKNVASARDCSPFCTDSDNSILREEWPTTPDHVTRSADTACRTDKIRQSHGVHSLLVQKWKHL